MTPERRRKADEVFRSALELPASERLAFVATACADDVELQREVETLLANAKETELRVRPSGSPGDATARGSSVGHYRIDGLLGAGGMGVVYRATDTRLDRPVAIKFLSETLLDAEARQRFQREAQLASGLNHPHIVTVHDVGEHRGAQYLVTELVDGVTLADWLQAERRSWQQSLDLLIGVADALATAHAASILHRDVKPGNILVSRAGYAKLADFGLAKSGDPARSSDDLNTRAGTLLGTIDYMSPEQLAGRALDQRSDIFAFGAVLYEAFAGRRPFTGETDIDVMHAIMRERPAPLAAELPEALRKIVEKAIAKDPAERYASMRDLVIDLRRASRKAAPTRRRRFAAAVAAAGVVAVVAGGAYLAWDRAAQARSARAEVIPEIARLTDNGDYRAAYALAQQVQRYVPDDPLLRSLTPLFSVAYAVTSTPPDATVLIRGYADTDEPWQPIGRTPIADASVARRPLRWRFEKEGFETVEIATPLEDDLSGVNSITATLVPQGAEPEMVYIDGGNVSQLINGRSVNATDLSPFYIDRFEVTNAAYKEFVDAGGYSQRSFWDGLELTRDGAPLAWEDAMRLFVDTTGRPGPASWELGDFPDGEGRHPVTGVSWYEAAAYARFRGKALPTVPQWTKAALPANNISGLTASIVPASNFGGVSAAAGGTYGSLGPYGTYDMHGNVSEWTANGDVEGDAWALGGSWQDPPYNFLAGVAASPLERNSTIGFRLVKQVGANATTPPLLQPIDVERPRITSRQPASDEVYEAYTRQFEYRRGELNATVPVTVETAEDWTTERVTVDTGYGERMDIVLFIPKSAQPPYQALVYFPPFDVILLPGSSTELTPGHRVAGPLDFAVKSGRVVVQPIYQGTYERYRAPLVFTDSQMVQRRWLDWRYDLGRTLDYLETRADIDPERIGYVGVSFGATFPLHLVALEQRFRAALFLEGGVFIEMPAPTDPVHYAARVDIPLLMINGRYDYVLPIEFQAALFDLFATPPEHKRRVVVEAGHVVPRSDILRESLGWLDEYLGPVR